MDREIYIEYIGSDDMTIRDAISHKAICYLPTATNAADRRAIEADAQVIFSALTPSDTGESDT